MLKKVELIQSLMGPIGGNENALVFLINSFISSDAYTGVSFI